MFMDGNMHDVSDCDCRDKNDAEIRVTRLTTETWEVKLATDGCESGMDRVRTIEGTALSLESIDNVEGCDSLSLGAGWDVSIYNFDAWCCKRGTYCSVYVTASRMTPSRKVFRTPRVSS